MVKKFLIVLYTLFYHLSNIFFSYLTIQIPPHALLTQIVLMMESVLMVFVGLM